MRAPRTTGPAPSTDAAPLRSPARRSRVGALALALVLVPLLGACGIEDVTSLTPSMTRSTSSSDAGAKEADASPAADASKKSDSDAEKKPSASPSPSASETVLPPNDLVNGSLRRTVPVSDFEVALDYWSTLSMAQWTPAANKPLTVSASAQWAQPSKLAAYISSFSYDVRDESGASVAHGVESAAVSPGYQFSAPYTYSTELNIPRLDPDVRVLTVDMRYDVLVQTSPKSSTFYKQTATDTLTITLTKDATS